MKNCAYIFLFAFLLLAGCGFKEREQKIARQEQELIHKQEALLLKEQQLALKEKELQERELLLDSTHKLADSVNLYEPAIAGKWTVTMNCTETNCEGSAIGDTKTEQWEISYGTDKAVTLKAFSGKELIRIYNGAYRTAGLQLAHENRIRINLKLTAPDKMEGTREITQPNCRIVYVVTAAKIEG
jgi:hypothetical protein